MSSQPLPQPIPCAAAPFDPAAGRPVPSVRPVCRALTVDGHRCKNKALGGLHLCYSHYRNRRPALPDPHNVSVPLLEDRSAIQLMATQVLQGLLSGRIDPLTARAAIATLRIAAATVPGLLRPLPRQQDGAPPPEETVCHIGRDHDDFISADGDLAEPPLNPSCAVAESADAARRLLESFQPVSRCDSESEDPDLPPHDPAHDWERCACFSCRDFRDAIQQRIQHARSAAG